MRIVLASLVVWSFCPSAMAGLVFFEDFESQTNPVSAPWTITSGAPGAVAGIGFTGKGVTNGSAGPNRADQSVGALGGDLVVTARLYTPTGGPAGTGSLLQIFSPSSNQRIRFFLRADRIDAQVTGGGGEVNPAAILDTWVDARVTAHYDTVTGTYTTGTIEHKLSTNSTWIVDLAGATTFPTFASATDLAVRIEVSSGGRIDDVNLTTVPVPEPSSIVLLGVGGTLAGLTMLRRRRRPA